MKLKKNDTISCEIVDINDDGQGVAKIDDEVVFIPFCLTGEKVDAVVINTKSKFAIAKATNITNLSPHRVEPKCKHFKMCGGCSFQHLVHSEQLVQKQKQVAQALKRIAHIETTVQPCISCNEYYYRNKIALPVSPDGKVGLYRKNTHRILPIDECPITKNWLPELLKAIEEFIKESKIKCFNPETNSGTLKHIVAREVDNQLLLTFVSTTEKFPDVSSLAKKLQPKFNSLGISLNINKLNNNVILSQNWKNLWGNNLITTEFFGVTYNISNASFSQVNDSIRNELYLKVLENISPTDTVIDAYSGAGLLSAIISKKAEYCYGIEIIKEATISADKLKTDNNILNLTNINGDCAKELPVLAKKLSSKELCVVLDPPRKGCDEKVLNALLSSQPTKIIYVSCNPQTLARDLKILTDTKEYAISFVQPFDMFPQTSHIETLVRLDRIK